MTPPQMSRSEAFAVLDLRGDADAAEVTRAYRRLARQRHPDAGGDPDAFHRLQVAYERLVRDGLPDTRPQPQPAPPPRPSREATSARHQAFVDDIVDVTAVDWERPVNGDRLDRDTLARRLVARSEGSPVSALRAASRGPGRRPSSLSRMLHTDRTATLRVEPAWDRGRHGHDVEIAVRAWTRRDRRAIEEATRPDGWVHTRGSSSTTLSRVIVPSREARATALRVATEVDAALTGAGWPLRDWAVAG